ncbi:MAG: Fic family protein [Acholeplasmatales bacterium]|nr:Fic family protein [Acholeplasmatales bacterium]
MNFLSVAEVAKLWSMSERSVRNYCAEGRIPGAILVGKTWMIPSNAAKPNRKARTSNSKKTLLYILKLEKESKLKGGIYHKVQIELTYNSNHIEGSCLTHDQTRYIYETNTIGLTNEVINVDDIVETANHFRCIDLIIDKANLNITENLIKQLHFILKNGTTDSRKNWFVVGDYKKLPNEVGGRVTTSPEKVEDEVKSLIEWYNNIKNKTLKDIIEFHYRFECIHPFQDGNGRVGRLLMFKECLKYNIVPFIIDDKLKTFYYRGLKEWKQEKGYLVDTCLAAQDQFKVYLDYFRIEHDK